MGDEWKEQRRQQKNTKDQKLLDIIEKMKVLEKERERMKRDLFFSSFFIF